MNNVDMVEFKFFGDDRGFLIPIEGLKNIDFDIKRVYYIYGVDSSQRRGFHSHRDLKQILICLNGSVDILTKTPFESKVTHLDRPNIGLEIGPMIWREMFNFSKDAVLLVLASAYYDENDYIRDYNNYLEEACLYFGEKR